MNGSVVCTLENSSSYIWVISGILSANFQGVGNSNWATGYVTLSGELTQLQVSMGTSGDNFNQGQLNIAYI